ncbi:2OG-Fe(II) oxygenase family protein [Delftia acidovorans]|uniref:2-oxoglutarate-dependent ethylene/succinate-forming enzyme n=1 Tax=Delftia acidovorans TaxID=80866 RepID=A0AAJ2R081_DELAC|nr:2OG-Fe(II) oxygenase family protein [Delftia acidovorans]MDX4953441.1 2OG-Fe(II) oxygenase family protein [Delftia acidovorans]
MNEIGIRPNLAVGKIGTLESVVQRIIKDGYCKFSVDDDLYNLVLEFAESVRSSDFEYKLSHSDQKHSDGFMGVGSEFSNINSYADICERFCYWYSRSEVNKKNGVTDAMVYKLAEQLENRMSRLADCILDEIFSKFDMDDKPSGRCYSYLQACLYYKDNAVNGRDYAQEPHEDGHFLTFITANSKGLSLHNGKVMEQVNFADGEFIVMAGSALSILSDHAIKSIYHSVDNQLEMNRTSVVYFLNPDLNKNYSSFYKRRLMNFSRHIQENHISFGNAEIN